MNCSYDCIISDIITQGKNLIEWTSDCETKDDLISVIDGAIKELNKIKEDLKEF